MVSEIDDRGLNVKKDVVGPIPHREGNPEPQTFTEFLQSWGGAWIWNRLVMPNDTIWLTETLTNNTLVCVMDDSYD